MGEAGEDERGRRNGRGRRRERQEKWERQEGMREAVLYRMGKKRVLLSVMLELARKLDLSLDL